MCLEAGEIYVDKSAHDGEHWTETNVELSFKEFELLDLFYGKSGDCTFQRKDSE